MDRKPQTLLQTSRFRVEQLQKQSPSGEVVRQVIRHPGAVVVLPVVDAERICLIKNYRIAVDETLIELPAGTLEPNEPPDVTAARELAEETGFHAARLNPINSFYLSPGILDEQMHLFVARDLTPGTPMREPGEQIENYVVTWQEALDMVYDGRIRDAKTIIGLLLGRRIEDSESAEQIPLR